MKKEYKNTSAKREKIKTAFKRIMSFIAVLAFVFGLIIFISVLKANKNEVPKVLGFSVMRVQTGSMEPELKTGCIVIAKETAQDKLNEGDIISFYSPDPDPFINGRVETHRIVQKRYLVSGEGLFTTKGDANPSDDTVPVTYRKIIGKVVLNLGVMSGSALGVLQNPKVIFFLIILPMIFITFSEAVNLVNLIVNRDEPEDQSADESDENKKDKNSD